MNSLPVIRLSARSWSRLEGGVAVLPPFPVHVMPATLRPFVEEVAASRQVAPDLRAMLALAVVKAAAAPRFEVHIGRSHAETLNLDVLGVLDSGERKTAAVNDAVLGTQRRRSSPGPRGRGRRTSRSG